MEPSVDGVPAGTLYMTHYGAAAWRFTDGRTTLWLDPYFSRIRYAGKAFGTSVAPVSPGDERPVYGLNDPLYPDVACIDAHVDRADYIVISHAHFNHCMDVPHIARKTGALVLGSRSACAVARANGVDRQQLLGVRGGEDYDFGPLSIRVVPSLHSPLNDKRYFEPLEIPDDIQAPLRLVDYVEGGTLAYYVRFGAHRILMFGSMNYIERELFGLEPTIVLVAAGRARLHIHDYTERLLSRLNHPPVVVATHWDIQTAPYGGPQELALAQADTFVDEVRRCSPRAQVLVPRHFDTIAVTAAGRATLQPAA